MIKVFYLFGLMAVIFLIVFVLITLKNIFYFTEHYIYFSKLYKEMVSKGVKFPHIKKEEDQEKEPETLWEESRASVKKWLSRYDK